MVRSSLFWDVARRSLVVCHRCFGTTRLTHLQGSGIPKREHILVECIFVVIGHIPFLILFCDALKPTRNHICICFQDPTQCSVLSVKYYWRDVSFYLLLRLNDMLYSGHCFCAKTGLCCHLYFALRWQNITKSNALLQRPPVLLQSVVDFCGHTGTTVTSLFPFIIPTATFLHIHLSPPVRFVMDVITTSALDLGCTSDPVLGFPGRKLLLRVFNSCSHLKLNCYADVDVLTL